MKRLLFSVTVLLAVLGFGVLTVPAVAQTYDPCVPCFAAPPGGSAPVASVDFASWGRSVLTFAGILLAATAFFTARVPHLTGWRTLVLVFTLGQFGAFLIHSAGLLTDPNFARFAPPLVWILFGLTASFVAAGGQNFLGQVLGHRTTAAQRRGVSS